MIYHQHRGCLGRWRPYLNIELSQLDEILGAGKAEPCMRCFSYSGRPQSAAVEVVVVGDENIAHVRQEGSA